MWQRHQVRGDIQGLRAVAVLLVLIFHVWPDLLPGGYVGVDVFFVISGYLIVGSLVKELEALGIGRPSTYAAIISTLLDREYVLLEKRRFEPTDLGEVVSKLLVKVFPDIFDVAFTSRMEGELDRVEEGEVGWRELLGDFHPRLERRLQEGSEMSDQVLLEILEVAGEHRRGEHYLDQRTQGARGVVKDDRRFGRPRRAAALSPFEDDVRHLLAAQGFGALAA